MQTPGNQNAPFPHLVARLVPSILPLAWQTAGLGRAQLRLCEFSVFEGTPTQAAPVRAKCLEKEAVDPPWASAGALELAGSGKPGLGLAGPGGAQCREPGPCQPFSPKQLPIVPVAPKFPEDLPTATLSRGHPLSKGPQWVTSGHTHGGWTDMVVPAFPEALGLPSPAGISQPGAWRRAGKGRSWGRSRAGLPPALVCRCWPQT